MPRFATTTVKINGQLFTVRSMIILVTFRARAHRSNRIILNLALAKASPHTLIISVMISWGHTFKKFAVLVLRYLEVFSGGESRTTIILNFVGV